LIRCGDGACGYGLAEIDTFVCLPFCHTERKPDCSQEKGNNSICAPDDKVYDPTIPEMIPILRMSKKAIPGFSLTGFFRTGW
jgi:hypothetical protein